MINNIIKWYIEIRHIGLRDWWFFVVVLKRDELNPKLDMAYYLTKAPLPFHRYNMLKALEELTDKRERAHKIDITLTDLWS